MKRLVSLLGLCLLCGLFASCTTPTKHGDAPVTVLPGKAYFTLSNPSFTIADLLKLTSGAIGSFLKADDPEFDRPKITDPSRARFNKIRTSLASSQSVLLVWIDQTGTVRNVLMFRDGKEVQDEQLVSEARLLKFREARLGNAPVDYIRSITATN